jgi:hypothetical protein
MPAAGVQLLAIAAAGGVLNRKQKRAVERYQAKAKEDVADIVASGAEPVEPADSPTQVAPTQAASAPATPKPDDASVGSLAELTALQASGTPLNRKQRRAFERLSAAS